MLIDKLDFVPDMNEKMPHPVLMSIFLGCF